MRTSCDFSVCISAQSYRFPFHSCTQGFLAALTHDPDATFQRDACTHLSLCIAQTGNSASSPKTRQFGVFLFPRWSLCLQRVIPADILIPHVVSLCETHACAHTCSVRLGRHFWVVVGRVDSGGRVYCGVDKQLVILQYG